MTSVFMYWAAKKNVLFFTRSVRSLANCRNINLSARVYMSLEANLSDGKRTFCNDLGIRETRSFCISLKDAVIILRLNNAIYR